MGGYNIQTAVDATHHLIVAPEVTNVGHDRSRRSMVAKRAREAMGNQQLAALAERGYFDSEEILACHNAGITTYLPKPQTSGNQHHELFGRDGFRYVAGDDVYRCPAGNA